MTGTRYVRVSDLALLQESQQQHLNGHGDGLIISARITADIDLHAHPSPELEGRTTSR